MEMKQYNQFELEEREEFQSDLGTSSSNYRQYLNIMIDNHGYHDGQSTTKQKIWQVEKK